MKHIALALCLAVAAMAAAEGPPRKRGAKRELPPVDASPENIARLIKQLDGGGMKNQLRARGAYQQLQRIGKAATPQLLEAVKSKSPWVRVWTAAALAHTRDPRAVEPMLKLLKDPFGTTRVIATWHITSLRHLDPRIPPAIARQLEDKDDWVRKKAGQALAHIKFKGAVEELRKLTHSDFDMARTTAFVLLLKADKVHNPAKAIAKAMTDKDWRLRSAAVRSMGEGALQDRKVALDLLLRALDDPNDEVKADAVQVIEHILKDTKCPKTKAPVVAALEKKLPRLLDAQLPRLRGAALYLLAAGDGPKLFPRAIAAVDATDPILRLYGLKCLARCGVRNWEVIDKAEARLSDEEPEVRQCAIAVLRWLSKGQLKVKFDPNAKPDVRAAQVKEIKALFDKARRRAGRL